MIMRKTRILSGEDCKFIEENYLDLPVKKIADILGSNHGMIMRYLKKAGLVIPKEIIDKRKKESRFYPGHVPATKGKKIEEFMTPEVMEIWKKKTFKKGNVPLNTLYDGAIRTRTPKKIGKLPYKWIRISKGNWKMLHVYLWEKRYGKPPEGHIIVFKDGDTLNCVLENLELITRQEGMMRNSMSRIPQELKETIIIKNKIIKKLNHGK